MKNKLLALIVLSFFFACSPRKNGAMNRGYQNFKAYYNTLFNSKEALETELNSREESFKDNFYSQYIPLLVYDEQPLGSDLSSNSFLADDDAGVPKGIGFGSGTSFKPNQGTSGQGASTLQIAEAKAMKAIANHSMMFGGEERNKRMFEAHILLAQSRLYQGKPLEALDALNYIFSKMKDNKHIQLARIYEAESYAKMGDYAKSEELFSNLQKEDLKKSEAKLLSIYYAQMLVNSGQEDKALEELEYAFEVNKNRTLRGRIAFLRGQVLNHLGKPEEARESFVAAYKYANDFEFEVKSQIEIAKTFNGTSDDYEGAKDYLEKISKKGIYMSRKNEFYYALGLMAEKADKEDEAQDYFRKALEGDASDPQIRGLTYYEIANHYFDKDDYISAGAYYDSAVAVMPYEPIRAEVQDLAANIKQITQNYYLVKKNDSILALTKMPEQDRAIYFGKYIDSLKAKEDKLALEAKKNRKGESFDTGDYDANSIFNTNSKSNTNLFSNASNSGTFYFANQNTVAKGNTEFKQIWGNRSLADNWRYSPTTASIDDLKNEAMGIATLANPRRFEVDYYTEQIPTDIKITSQLKADRDTASLGLGRMYEEYFGKTKLATQTLYDLVDNRPKEDVKLQALYLIFAMNYEMNPNDAERAKQTILKEFPYTSYAEFVKNPKSATFSNSSPEVEKMYEEAFDLYQNEKYDESKILITQALSTYPKDMLVPKFALLNAFNVGKTSGKEIMILQLQQIALNYGKTPEGEKAEEMLRFLKSDLKDDYMDENGKAIAKPKSTTPNSTTENKNQPPLKRVDQSGVGSPANPNDSKTEVPNPYKPPKRRTN